MSNILPPERSNYHLNARASRLCRELVDQACQYNVVNLDTGLHAPVIDCGVNTHGSLAAGLMLSRIAMSDLADIQLVMGPRGPHIQVRTDFPVAACMLSQYAGWQITGEKYFAMGSGPMRAAVAKEELFARLNYREVSPTAVGVLETRKVPPIAVAEQLATACDVDIRQLILLVAPTASIAGTMQIVARSIETALHKLESLQFDLWRIVSGFGVAPLPPIAGDDLVAIGWTNDAILYGADVTLWVTGDDASLEQIIGKIPSSASSDHGAPFAEIFERYDRDFYKIDSHLFSPARIHLVNIETGHRFSAGHIESDVLSASFGY